MRWYASEDGDGAPPSRRWTPAVGLAALVLGAAAALAGTSSSPAPREADAVPGAEQAAEPVGRAALPHTVRSSPVPALPPAAAPAAEEVAEAAVTQRAVPAPAAAPVVVVVALGGACDLPGATAVTAGGVPAVCSGGRGNGAPRWHRA